MEIPITRKSATACAKTLKQNAGDEGAMKDLLRHVNGVVSNLWEKGHDGGETLRAVKSNAAKKWLIAEEDMQKGRFVNMALYPSAEHAQKFASSIPMLIYKGPSETYPGAVGVVRVQRTPNGFHIPFMQGTFRQAAFGGAQLVPRSVATKYGGWREHLLDRLFEKAKDEGIGQVTMAAITRDYNHERYVPGGHENANKFTAAAQRHGFEVNKKDGEIVACRR